MYVNQAIGASGDGTTWATSFKTLQDALNVACVCGNVKEIWVAQGTYYPDEGVGITDNDRDTSFVLCDGIKLYGGFSGTETMLSERDWTNNVTILSGDLMGNDGPNFANNTDNAYHVVIGSNTDGTAVLNGFTITAGNANNFQASNNRGGGMYNVNGSTTIASCIFSGNSALGFAKIRLETDAKMSAETNEDGLIIIKAIFPKK